MKKRTRPSPPPRKKARSCEFPSPTPTAITSATKPHSPSSKRIDQIVFRYTTPDGSNDSAGNPNGSLNNIAGICNRQRNVAGLMPHPERAVESALDSDDGLVIFRSMVESLVGAKATA